MRSMLQMLLKPQVLLTRARMVKDINKIQMVKITAPPHIILKCILDQKAGDKHFLIANKMEILKKIIKIKTQVSISLPLKKSNSIQLE